MGGGNYLEYQGLQELTQRDRTTGGGGSLGGMGGRGLHSSTSHLNLSNLFH